MTDKQTGDKPQQPTGPDPSRMSPDKLMTGYARTPFWLYLLVSLVVMALVIVGGSYGYIRDRWVDPEGAAARAAASQTVPDPQPPQTAEPSTADQTPGQAGQPAPAAGGDQAETPRDPRLDAPIVDEMTRVADPAEIPTRPDLGISIEDTNR